MDSDLIYTKTAAGEEAVRQRARFVQRNMRMVLILVDGKSTVADLCTKTAKGPITESALHDLEQGGFIEPIMARNPIREQGEKVAQEIDASVLGHALPQSFSGTKIEEERVEPPCLPSPAPALRDDPPSLPAVLASTSAIQLTPIDDVSIFGGESVPDFPEAPPKIKPVKQTALLDRLTGLLPSRKPRKADDDFSIRPIRRSAERYYITWPIALIFGVVGACVLIFLVALLFPYGNYLPEVEAELAQASGQPAKIDEMRVSFYPKPGLFLNNVRIGSAGDGKEIRISEIRLLPLLATIMAPRKVFLEVGLNGVALSAEALAGLSGIFDSVAQSSAKGGVQHVTLEGIDISFRGLVFSGMSGEAKLTSDGHFNSLDLYSADRNLHFEAKPVATGVDIELEVYGWRPSKESLFIFDSGNVKGNLNGAALTLSKIELRIFDGLVQGKTVLRADHQPSMVGEISFERIGARRLGEALGIGSQFDGEATGKMKFSATADSWPTIFSRLDAEGDFSMRRGVLGAIDLGEAVRRMSAVPTRGGSTRFELLSGRLKLTPDNYHFTDLALSSGLMQSVGQITVSKDRQVSGRMEMQMRGTVNRLRMPVSISGPLNAPLLQAGKN